MKVRELRELLSEFDQDAEVMVENLNDVTSDPVIDIVDIDTNEDDVVVLQVE